jgi:hypothetical protein
MGKLGVQFSKRAGDLHTVFIYNSCKTSTFICDNFKLRVKKKKSQKNSLNNHEEIILIKIINK